MRNFVIKIYTPMANNNDNNSETKTSAKMEFTINVTLSDGTVITRKVETAVPDKGEMDLSSIEGLRRSFDVYERAVIDARNKICNDISKKYMEELSKKKTKK